MFYVVHIFASIWFYVLFAQDGNGTYDCGFDFGGVGLTDLAGIIPYVGFCRYNTYVLNRIRQMHNIGRRHDTISQEADPRTAHPPRHIISQEAADDPRTRPPTRLFPRKLPDPRTLPT